MFDGCSHRLVAFKSVVSSDIPDVLLCAAPTPIHWALYHAITRSTGLLVFDRIVLQCYLTPLCCCWAFSEGRNTAFWIHYHCEPNSLKNPFWPSSQRVEQQFLKDQDRSQIVWVPTCPKPQTVSCYPVCLWHYLGLQFFSWIRDDKSGYMWIICLNMSK